MQEKPHSFETAMILAAGKGTRMQPLTFKTPKPLIKVGGKCLIDHNLDMLAAAGIKKVVVNTHYLSEQIEHHLATRKDFDVMISSEKEQLLDSGGGIKNALNLLGSGPVLALNADTFWLDTHQNTLCAMLENWDAAAMDVLLMLADPQRSIGYSGPGDFIVDQYGRLKRLSKSDKVGVPFAGAYIIARHLFDHAPSTPFSVNKLFDRAIDEERLFGFPLDGLWLHVGKPDAIVAAEIAMAGFQTHRTM